MSREKRKLDHIQHALLTGQSRLHGFDDLKFVHQSIPNTAVNEIDISTKIGELFLSSPILVNAMTGGGGQKTERINEMLATVAKMHSIPIAVGSQMSAIKNRDERQTFEIVRQVYPEGIIFSNLGSEATVEDAKIAIDMVQANGIQIHLNVIQELVMPEGDRDFSNALIRIENIVRELGVPVIVKEVGFGISKETAVLLREVGVTAIDVGGAGGTNFSQVENKRRKKTLNYFNQWGIPTAASLAEVSSVVRDTTIIGSGGIQTALDVAKAIALGACATGFAGYFLKMLLDGGEEALHQEIEDILLDLRLIMAALGATSIRELQTVPLVISGQTFHWLNQRGIDTTFYGKRGW